MYKLSSNEVGFLSHVSYLGSKYTPSLIDFYLSDEYLKNCYKSEINFFRKYYWITDKNNFRAIVNNKYTYYSCKAENEGWTWVIKQKKIGNKLKENEIPVAWCTNRFGKIFPLYKKNQFE